MNWKAVIGQLEKGDEPGLHELNAKIEELAELEELEKIIEERQRTRLKKQNVFFSAFFLTSGKPRVWLRGYEGSPYELKGRPFRSKADGLEHLLATAGLGACCDFSGGDPVHIIPDGTASVDRRGSQKTNGYESCRLPIQIPARYRKRLWPYYAHTPSGYLLAEHDAGTGMERNSPRIGPTVGRGAHNP